MRRQHFYSLIAVCVLLLSVGFVQPGVTGGAGVAGAAASGPDPDHLPIAGLLKETRLDITYPRIDDVYVYYGDADWPGGIELPGAEDVNWVIREQALSLLGQLAEFGHVEGGYEVSRADLDLISVTMQYAGYDERMAHPAHLRASVTADPSTGRVYELADLFVDDTYVDRLSEAVAARLEEGAVDIVVPFEGIRSDQDFYITACGLVLYFQVYELAPYAAGFPEFVIPYETIADIVRADGPALCPGLSPVE